MKIIALGPKGTFSHMAALEYNPKATIIFEKTIYDVMAKVKNESNEKNTPLGIVPLENSISGTIGEALDCLMEFDLKIIAEEIIPIRYYLVGKIKKPKEIKRIYSHPQAFSQCEKFILKNYSYAEIIETSSNGASAQLLAKSQSFSSAAIVPPLALEIYPLIILKENIQDNPFNVTRFVVVAKKNQNQPTSYDRTSLAIYPQIDRPGLLYEILGEFAQRKINLSKIESRPAKGKLGDYIFFIDFEGHMKEKKAKEVLSSLEKSVFVKVFGSYPRKY